MLSKIEPIIDIIVLTKYKGVYHWFISEKELWFLDYKKYTHEFDPTDNNFEERFNIELLDEYTFEEFLPNVVELEFKTDQLKKKFEQLLPLTDWDSSFHLFPTLFIDFDDKKLFSVYQESISFEDYIPNSSWVGVYDDFYNLIPSEEKYWIINDIDHYILLLEKNSDTLGKTKEK